MKIATRNEIARPSVSQELMAASTAASLSFKDATRQLRLVNSDLPSLIPSGSSLRIRSAKFSELKMGDLIGVRIGSELAVRRFVKTKMTKSDTLLLTAKEGLKKKEPLSRTCLLGKIEKVTCGGRSYNPAQAENILQQFWGKLTEYGTHKPFGLFKA